MTTSVYQLRTAEPYSHFVEYPENYLSTLDISARLRNCLAHYGVKSSKDILSIDPLKFWKQPNVGMGTIEELKLLQSSLSLQDESDCSPSALAEIHHANDFRLDEMNISTRLRNGLNKLGIYYYSGLMKVNPRLFAKSESIGKMTVEELIEIQSSNSLATSVRSQRSSKLTETLILPKFISSDDSFPDICRKCFEDQCEYLPDKEKDIAFNRIWPDDNSSLETLEVLGQRNGVTKERIRQIERKFLKLLVKFLCHGSPIKIGTSSIHLMVQSEISAKWAMASREIISANEIDICDFFNVIQNCFDCTSHQTDKIIQFAATIFSQSVVNNLRTELRKVGSNLLLLSDLPENILNLRLTDLRLGKKAVTLAETFGIETLEDTIGNLTNIPTNTRNILEQRLETLYGSIQSDSKIDWQKFSKELDPNSDNKCTTLD